MYLQVLRTLLQFGRKHACRWKQFARHFWGHMSHVCDQFLTSCMSAAVMASAAITDLWMLRKAQYNSTSCEKCCDACSDNCIWLFDGSSWGQVCGAIGVVPHVVHLPCPGTLVVALLLYIAV